MTPLSNCVRNQKPRKKTAGTSNRKKIGTHINTRECGYSTKYAPITPAIAPLAPTVGICDDGSLKKCASVAMAPHSR